MNQEIMLRNKYGTYLMDSTRRIKRFTRLKGTEWHPSGQKILAFDDSGNYYEVYMNRNKKYIPYKKKGLLGFSYSPMGKYLISSYLHTNIQNLTTKLENIVYRSSGIKTLTSDRNFKISPDDRLIAFDGRSFPLSNIEVYVFPKKDFIVDIDVNNIKPGSLLSGYQWKNPEEIIIFLDSSNYNYDFEEFEDEKTFACTYNVRTRTKHTVELRTGAEILFEPNVSRNGRYNASEDEGESKIHDLITGEVIQLLPGALFIKDWNKYGDKILYTTSDDQMYLTNIRGGTEYIGDFKVAKFRPM